MASGTSSQWADTIRIDLGRGMCSAQVASCFGQIGSSARGGAPWLRYRVGMRAAVIAVDSLKLHVYGPQIEASTKPRVSLVQGALAVDAVQDASADDRQLPQVVRAE